MPTYIKAGFWIKSREKFDHWLNLDALIAGHSIPEAPEDSKTYGRNNGNWVEVTGGSGGSQDLTSVLTNGYSVDNLPIIINRTSGSFQSGFVLANPIQETSHLDGGFKIALNDLSQVTTYSNGLITYNNTNGTLALSIPAVNLNKNLPLSVNGIFADENGNIIASSTIPTLTEVLTSGSSASDQYIYLNGTSGYVTQIGSTEYKITEQSTGNTVGFIGTNLYGTKAGYTGTGNSIDLVKLTDGSCLYQLIDKPNGNYLIPTTEDINTQTIVDSDVTATKDNSEAYILKGSLPFTKFGSRIDNGTVGTGNILTELVNTPQESRMVVYSNDSLDIDSVVLSSGKTTIKSETPTGVINIVTQQPATVDTVIRFPAPAEDGVYDLALEQNTVNKIGDSFSYSTDFDDVLSQNSNLEISKRTIQPEATRLPIANTTILGWGDSLTNGSGGGGTTYLTTLNSLTAYTCTNKGVGGETSTQIKTRFIADTTNYDKTVIIWAGRNNYTSPTTIKSDIAEMVAALTHTRYLIIGVINGEYAYEYSGGAGYNFIIQLNTDLKAIYGKKFIDIRSYLISLHDNSAQDLIDFGHDIVPTSLRTDEVHLNSTGYTKVGEYINRRLGILFEKEGYLQSKDFLYYNNLYSSVNNILNQSAITQTGTYNISGSAASSNIIARNGTATGFTKPSYLFQTPTASNRFSLNLTGDESTGNLGSNLSMLTYSDAGATLLNPFTVFRGTGHIVIKSTGAVATDNGFVFEVQGTTKLGGGAITTSLPATSASTFNIITRGISSTQLECLPSNYYALNVLTGYVSGAGTVTSTDSPLQAIQKLNGNDALKSPIANPTFTGIVTAPTIISTGVVRLKSYIVSGLPVGTQGDTAYVTDALAPTYLGALTGGGTVTCPAFHNGTTWVAH